MASIINASTTAGLVNTADTSGILQLQTANTTAVTVDASQNVTFAGVTTLQAGTAALPALTTTGDTNTGIFFPAADTIAFSEGGAESMRINSAGELLVGTTSQQINEVAFVANSTENTCTLKTTRTSTGNGVQPLMLWNSGTSGDNGITAFFTETSYTSRGSIDYNRGSSVIRYNTTSDATLKNLIGDAPKQKSIDILNDTKIREYSWKDDATNKPQIGVIAQELHETFKGAVSVGGNKVTTDAEGNETTEYLPWGVDKTAFTFHLVAGWQEHQRIIQEQQALITQLQADVATLKGTP